MKSFLQAAAKVVFENKKGIWLIKDGFLWDFTLKLMLQFRFQALDKQEFQSISTLLNAIQKCGRKISIAGEDGLPAMIKHGLVGRISKTINHL